MKRNTQRRESDLIDISFDLMEQIYVLVPNYFVYYNSIKRILNTR
jgi:hypothetical protein